MCRLVALGCVVLAAGCGDDAMPPADAGPPPDADLPVLYASGVVTSRAGARLSPLPELELTAPVSPGSRLRFAVDVDTRHQSIAGFGASFLEAGLVVLNSIPERANQDAVLRALFDPVEGAGFSLMKTVIGGTDFQSAHPEWFTYDDTPGDVALDDFSIARDLEPNGVLTYIMRAREAGGDFGLQASMDYPPDWMLIDEFSDQNVDPAHYETLARYYLRYLRAYEAEGVRIDALALFNEPGNYTKISIAQIGALLRDHVGPLLEAEGIDIVLMPTEPGTRAHAGDYYPPIFDDPDTRRYIDAAGYHGYDRTNFERIAGLLSDYPDIPLWMTEVCCLEWQQSSDWSDGDIWGNVMFSDLEAGASAWIYWNMILDTDGGPWLIDPQHNNPVENDQASVVIIDRATGEVTYTALYYYLAHLSRYVRPDAVRVETTPRSSGDVRALSFVNADGSRAVELMNSGESDAEVQIDADGRSLRLSLPASSITTLTWQPS